MTDFALEGIRALVLAALVTYLLVQGRRRADLARGGWRLVQVGFLLLLFGSLLDITDNFEALNRYVVIGDTPVEAFLEKLVGFLGGFICIGIGLVRWIPTVAGMEQVERIREELEHANARLARSNEELHLLTERLVTENYELVSDARLDDLTGLLTRAAWLAEAAHESVKCRQVDRPYGILVIDIDNFKLYNDTAGHQQGDVCLRAVAEAIRDASRQLTDIVGRYGGEEFAVLAPGASVEAAAALAERIRARLHERAIEHPAFPDGIVTVSIGVASGIEERWSEVFRRADAALYEAKAAGKDQICLAPRAKAA